MSDQKLSSWRLNSPAVQVFFMSLVLALEPGVFNALAGLGSGGGRASSQHVASVVSSTLYAIYAFTGMTAAVLINTLGPRWTLTLGAFGYPFYTAAFWYFDKTGKTWFPYFSGVVLGITAGWLWSTCSYVTTAYGTEQNRGKYFAMQGVVTGLGGCVAAGVVFGLSSEGKTDSGIPLSCYAVFTSLMLAGVIVSAVVILPSSKIIRDDGTAIAIFAPKERLSFMEEFKGVLRLAKDWRMLALIITFFGAELPVIVLPSMNAYFFNTRSRTLLSFIYSFAQIPGVMIFWPLLDSERLSRRTRAIVATGSIFVLSVAAWAGALGWMSIHGKAKNSNDVNRHAPGPNYDWSDGAFGGFFVLYFIFGALYVAYVMVCGWILACLTNSPGRLARYAGLLRGAVAGGICFGAGIDSTILPFYAEIGYAFGLQFVGLCILMYIALTQVNNTQYFHEDDVIVPVAVLEAEEKVHPDLVAHERAIHGGVIHGGADGQDNLSDVKEAV